MKISLLLIVFLCLSCSGDVSVQNPIDPSDCGDQIASKPAEDLFAKKDAGCRLED